MSVDVECVVVGAGVIGLAVARALADAGSETLLLEAEADFGTQTSSRSSEVIHAGIYYPQNSLKARLCLAGREALYRFCQSRHIPYRRCGKIIVAVNEAQATELGRIQSIAKRNGVQDIEWLQTADLAKLEPDLAGVSGLHSPSTGIVDSHALMLQLLAEAESCGAILACHSPVQSISIDSGVFSINVGGAEPTQLTSRLVVNAAGLGAVNLMCNIENFPPELIPENRYAKGCYYRLMGKVPFQRLVYPVPEVGGLGIHLTLDMAGNARFGPNVVWCDDVNYDVPEELHTQFVNGIKHYWPNLPKSALIPDYAGVRPKIAFGNDIYPDFLIQGPENHKLPGLVNLCGIESPGITASLAIADYVKTLLKI